nr:hypothetical protein CFP56_71264 [Quercus suber]
MCAADMYTDRRLTRSQASKGGLKAEHGIAKVLYLRWGSLATGQHRVQQRISVVDDDNDRHGLHGPSPPHGTLLQVSDGVQANRPLLAPSPPPALLLRKPLTLSSTSYLLVHLQGVHMASSTSSSPVPSASPPLSIFIVAAISCRSVTVHHSTIPTTPLTAFHAPHPPAMGSSPPSARLELTAL